MPVGYGLLCVAEPARRSPQRRRRGLQLDERGEVLPVVILFIGVLFTILIGVHVVIVAVARTAAQSAADRAVAYALVAGPGDSLTDCDADPSDTDSLRECQGILGAQRALTALPGFVYWTRPAAVRVQPEQGTVHALVFVKTLSPVFGSLELSGFACGPLDDVPISQLGPGAWQC